MSANSYQRRIEELLDQADVVVDGSRPWDLQVKNSHLYQRVLAQGSLGFGEAYMDGWWDADSPDQLLTKLLRARLDQQVKSLSLLRDGVKAKLLNRQSLRRAHQVGERHYNVGNELYRNMLDKRMIYSCAYWKVAQNLDQAQEHKLDLICRKLDLRPGLKVLDIGCGWGGTAKFMAENYAVEVTGVTISSEQARFATQNCRDLPIEIRLQDYRTLDGCFDRIVSVGMFEHVGYKNYKTYFSKVAELLADDGLFLLHTIGGNEPTTHTDPWIERYIFPNGMIPSSQQISKAFEGILVLEDWHNFGTDYDRTLLAWRDNFRAAWPDLQQSYGERFRRMWCHYLNCSAASFRSRSNHVWQMVFSKTGIPGGRQFPR